MKADNKRALSPRDRKWPVFLVVTTGVFLSTMDSSMVNVALPSIMRAFSSELVQVQWVVLVYLLTITVTLLFWGITADYIGKDFLYLAGITVFCAGSVGCSQAASLGWLIMFRLAEGTGAAMMMSAGPAIIRDVFPRDDIGKALGLVGIATSIGLMSGPLTSGLLLKLFSWRAVFLVNVPVCVLLLFLGRRVLKKPGVISEPTKSAMFDWKGAFFWMMLISSLILYAHFLPSFSVVGKLLGFLLIVVFGVLFVWAERTRKSTILPLHLFGKKYYHIGLITSALSFAVLFVVLILMPFYLDYIKDIRADMIGAVMMSVPLTLFIVSPTAGYLYDRFGSRYLTTGGLLCSFAALLLLCTIDGDSSLFGIGWRLALLGMGQSMFLSPNTASLLTRIKDADASITSGLLATARNLGMLVGSAFAGIVFAAWFDWFGDGMKLSSYAPTQASVFMSALHATFFCAAFFSLGAAVISWQRER